MKKTGVVIPCFMGGDITLKLVEDLKIYADLIVLIDDKCPLQTGKKLKEKFNDPNIEVIFNKENLGVGGATKKGFDFLLKKRCEIIIKMDADYQMDPAHIPKLINPIIRKECDSTKGNRFTNVDSLLKMPKLRLIGNTFLSYLSKLSTGYWEIFDPTNGFIAFDSNSLKKISYSKADNRYFFETDILFRCSLQNINIKNISIDSLYNNHFSSLQPLKEMIPFFIKNLKLLFKRIIYQYFLLDFNVGSVNLILSIFFGITSFFYLVYLLIKTNMTNIYTSSGQASFFSIISVISMQFFLSFIFYDCSIKVFLRKK
tara:strand:+ start:163 stop:1104 length:942 start_codon:yes stop_codon:yes gene_type:complete